MRRMNKINENLVDVKKGSVAVPKKIGILPKTDRMAFGDVGNLTKNNPTGAESQAIKPTKPKMYLKDVKAKVDTHWKVDELPNGYKNVPAKTYSPSCKEQNKNQENNLDRKSPKDNARKEHLKTSGPSATCSAASPDNNRSDSASSFQYIEDIDEKDNGNLIYGSEYVKDIYNYLHAQQNVFAIREDHLNCQMQVTPKMRSILFDWINEVHLQFHLILDTYYLTVSIVDRFLQIVPTTTRKNLQLVGVTAMFIASKYEEMFPPVLKDFVYITDSAYSAETIIEMEKYILKKLEYNLSTPLVIHFARRFAKSAMTVEYDYVVSKYFIELSSIEYSMAHYLPSMIAAASIFVTMKILSKQESTNEDIWTPKMIHYTKYTLDDMRPVIRDLAKVVIATPKASEKSVYNKYEEVAIRSEIYGPVMIALCRF